MKKKDRKALPAPVIVPSAEMPKTGSGPVDITKKAIRIGLLEGSEVFLPANRFRVDTIEGAVVLYMTYQDVYEEKVKRAHALTIPIFVLKEHFVNQTKDIFEKSVNRCRVPSYQAVKVLTPEELRETEITNFAVNFGGLAISPESGGEAFFAVYSPSQSQTLLQAQSAKPGEGPFIPLRNVLKFIMLGHIFAQLWDELVKAHDQIEGLK